MPNNYLGPWAGGGTARQRNSVMTSRMAYRLARVAGKYAREKYDEYQKGKGNAPKPRGRPKGSKNKPKFEPTYTYAVRNANKFVGQSYGGSMRIASKADLSKIKRPVKGKFNHPRGVLVVNKKKGKLLRGQKREYPHSVYQTYYLSNVNLDANGNIGSLDRRYTNMSVNSKTSTGFLLNLGANCLAWDPTKDYGKIGNVELPAQADANVTNPNPYWLMNGSNTGLEQDPIMLKQSKLPETATPYQQGTMPAVLKYTIPNHVIGQLDLNLSFMSASICDQIVSVTVLRNISSEPTQPGNWSNVGTNGGVPGADTIKLLCNDIKNVTGRQYETLFRTTRYIKGINLADKDPKVYYVKKKLVMNYQRSTCRRVTSALDNTLLGGQWSPSYHIDQSGALYNNLVVRVMTKCIDNGKIVSNYKGAHSSAGTVDYYDIPQLIDMDNPPSYWANANIRKSRIRFGGTVGIKCYVKEYNRGLGGDVAFSVGELQDQINDLTAQVSTLQGEIEEAHDEIDEHIDEHNNETDTDEGESYTHTHGGDTALHVYGHAREHSHPETTTHQHDEEVVE
jgi:hypothetical protein